MERDAVTSRFDGEVVERSDRSADPWEGADEAALACAQAARPVPGVEDMASYLAAQVPGAVPSAV